MQTKEKIYFIISGVREGFKKSHLLTNNNISEVIDYIDDRRQISNSANDRFYSIEKTQNYNLFSIFNPNTIDQVGRKAYIAITLFVKKDYLIIGNLIDTLNGLMNYYEQKQGNEFTNRFTDEMFEVEYSSLYIQHKPTSDLGIRSKQGYFIYDHLSEIASFFDFPAINGYQKVYFLSNNNNEVVNQLIAFEKITAFPKNVNFQLTDFRTGIYEVLINNKTYSFSGMLNQNNLTIFANQGDSLTIINRNTKKTHTLTVNYPGQNINIYHYFPEDKPKPPPAYNPNTQNQYKGAVGGHKNQAPERKKFEKGLLIMIGILVPIVIGLVVYTTGGWGEANGGSGGTGGGSGTAVVSPTTNSPTIETNIPKTVSPSVETVSPSSEEQEKKKKEQEKKKKEKAEKDAAGANAKKDKEGVTQGKGYCPICKDNEIEINRKSGVDREAFQKKWNNHKKSKEHKP